ncbi:hypothetical protein SD37_17090 [Amycolatopsis orientalis]|uniref:Bacterial transcriptional activator domain-containing protein n=1 Tax=Amycolatopsis orientalis TaxID=31958 RepID=A0A193BYE2_AMYOR|nr:hypothetical protein [Amycolatopsis orientalis]ANN17188.1 hypothetical protein SD37_17090 [Amycolatopsis orientalis]
MAVATNWRRNPRSRTRPGCDSAATRHVCLTPLTSQGQGNAVCAETLGSGCQLAEFHDGSSSWSCAYIWALCGDTASCRYALERLLPYTGRAVTNGSGILCWGSIDHFLGEVAAGAGEPELALALFRQAAGHNADLQAAHWHRRSVRRIEELDSAHTA